MEGCRMRILMVNMLYKPTLLGGAERSVTLLSEALVRAGQEVTVVTLHEGSQEQVEEIDGVKVYRLPLENCYWPYEKGAVRSTAEKLQWHLRDLWNRKAAARFGQILDADKPDVVHTNVISGFSVSIWPEVKKRGIGLVHSLRNYYMVCDKVTLYRQGKVCAKRCLSCRTLTAPRYHAAQYVDTVIGITRFVLDEHQRHGCFAQSNTVVIHNIAEMPEANRSGAEQERSGRMVFGFIGAIMPEKGIEVLLEACQKLRGEEWSLRIGGEGAEAYQKALQERFPDRRIEWLGRVKASEFYASIDVAVIPSVWLEPLGRIVFETFAAGKSAICAESGGIPEIAAYGRQVATYPAASSTKLAALMDAAMGDAAAWRVGGIRDEAEFAEAFSAEAVAQKHLAVYRAAAGGKA